MPKYKTSDGNTFEVISIAEAQKEIEERGGVDTDTLFNRVKDTLFIWWIYLSKTI